MEKYGEYIKVVRNIALLIRIDYLKYIDGLEVLNYRKILCNTIRCEQLQGAAEIVIYKRCPQVKKKL